MFKIVRVCWYRGVDTVQSKVSHSPPPPSFSFSVFLSLSLSSSLIRQDRIEYSLKLLFQPKIQKDSQQIAYIDDNCHLAHDSARLSPIVEFS